MMETSIADFRTSFYITAVQNLEFNLPHARILRINHRGNTCHKAFKRRSADQHMVCCRDYAERVVSNFAHQIQ